MRDIVASSTNIMLSKDTDGNWFPFAEVVLITSEPQYRFDEDLELKKRRRECEQFRFAATEAAVTEMINALEKARFEIQAQSHAAELANQEKQTA